MHVHVSGRLQRLAQLRISVRIRGGERGAQAHRPHSQAWQHRMSAAAGAAFRRGILVSLPVRSALHHCGGPFAPGWPTCTAAAALLPGNMMCKRNTRGCVMDAFSREGSRAGWGHAIRSDEHKRTHNMGCAGEVGTRTAAAAGPAQPAHCLCRVNPASILLQTDGLLLHNNHRRLQVVHHIVRHTAQAHERHNGAAWGWGWMGVGS